MKKLTDKHFCFFIFLEMPPEDFANLLQTNAVVDCLVFLDPKSNLELYNEAKELMCGKEMGSVFLDFDYDSEPFVFNKYINGKLDRAYKICIFEAKEEEMSYTGQTSNVYCDGTPLFFDPEGNMIKPSLN